MHATLFGVAAFVALPSGTPAAAFVTHVRLGPENAPPEPPLPPPPLPAAPPVGREPVDAPETREPAPEIDAVVDETHELPIGAPQLVPVARLRTPLPIPRQRVTPEPAPRRVARPRPPRRTGVTRGPRLLSGHARKPEYPRRAERLGLEGRVVLRVLVTPAGAVRTVEVSASSGHASLDDAAVAAAKTWRFRPAERDGRPVAAWYRRSIRFALTVDSPLHG